MIIRLNERKAADLKPAKASYEVRDIVMRGLLLRVGVKGQKVWEVVVPDGKSASGRPRRKRTRLGLFPEMSVQDARQAAGDLKSDRFALGGPRGVKTVRDLFTLYASARNKQMRSFQDVESVWRIWAEPRIGDVRLSDLSIHHGIDLRDYIASESSLTRSSSAIRVLRPMFSWAASEAYIPTNPWLGLKVRLSSVSRDRILSDAEWERLWNTASAIDYPFGPWLQALMLSGQRKSNVAQMRWDEIVGDVWTIPASKMKATRPDRAKAHEVPMSRSLSEMIFSQPRVCDYVFTSRDGKPIVPGSKLLNRVSQQAVLLDWRWHDVRRTAATLMTSHGVSRFIVERVLGHSDSSITAVNDRASYRTDKRSALEILASTVLPTSGADGTQYV